MSVVFASKSLRSHTCHSYIWMSASQEARLAESPVIAKYLKQYNLGKLVPKRQGFRTYIEEKALTTEERADHDLSKAFDTERASIENVVETSFRRVFGPANRLKTSKPVTPDVFLSLCYDGTGDLKRFMFPCWEPPVLSSKRRVSTKLARQQRTDLIARLGAKTVCKDQCHLM